MRDGKVRVYTENDEGLENEIIHDIGPGPSAGPLGTSSEVWIATHKGTGIFDGQRWRFPKLGPFYLSASALGHDARGNSFIGTVKGIFCRGACAEGAIDSQRGLLDDLVRDVAVDDRGRVWVLTEKGISIVDP
jgi:ligand-binding sensor domain-containing protein